MFGLFLVATDFYGPAVLSAQTTPVDSLYQEAANAYYSGDHNLAIDLYTQVLSQDSSYVNAIYDRGLIYGNIQQYDLAITDLRLVTRLAPNYANGWGNLGWYLILQGRWDEAQPVCKQAVSLDGSTMAWTLNMGHIYLFSDEMDSARSYYTKTLSLLESEKMFQEGPVADFNLFISKDWQTEACRRELAWMQKAFDGSFLYYQQANTAQTEADSLRAAEQYDAAIERYHNAAEVEELSMYPRWDRLGKHFSFQAYCYYQLGRYEEAEQFDQRALKTREEKLGPDHPDVAISLSNLGNLYLDQGRFEEAESMFRRALAIDEKGGRLSDMAISLSNLGHLYRGQDRYNRAVHFLQRALAIHTDPEQARKIEAEIIMLNFKRRVLNTEKYAYLFPEPQEGWDAAPVDVTVSESSKPGTYTSPDVHLRLVRIYQINQKKIEMALDTENTQVALRILGAHEDTKIRDQMAGGRITIRLFGVHRGLVADAGDGKVGILIGVGKTGVLSLAGDYAGCEKDLERYLASMDLAAISHFSDDVR